MFKPGDVPIEWKGPRMNMNAELPRSAMPINHFLPRLKKPNWC